jgi:hypothetical protein
LIADGIPSLLKVGNSVLASYLFIQIGVMCVNNRNHKNAEKFNATLIGLSALAVHPPFLIEGVAIQQATAADIVEIMATLTAKGDWFRNIAAMDHQRIEWRQVLDYPADALAREARGADLVVIGQTKGPGDALGSLDPGEALLKIGRPTLVVPDQVTSLRAEHVVIGMSDNTRYS